MKTIIHPEAHALALKLLSSRHHVHIVGPTGSGKTILAHQLLDRLDPGTEHIVFTCTAETTADDLLGRYLIEGGNTVFHPGPLLRAVEEGRIIYLDEIDHLPSSTAQVLYSLTDDTRGIWCAGRNAFVRAERGFVVLTSGIPPWRAAEPLRHRFCVVSVEYVDPETEAQMLIDAHEVSPDRARQLASIAAHVRRMRTGNATVSMSTRLVAYAARAMSLGLTIREAMRVAVAGPMFARPEDAAAFIDEIEMRGVFDAPDRPTQDRREDDWGDADDDEADDVRN